MILRLESLLIGALLCVLLLLTPAKPSAIKEAIEEHLKDVAHSDEAESLKHDKQKGETVHNLESDVKEVHKNQVSKASDEAKYVTKDMDKKYKSDADSYEGYNSMKDKAEESEASGFKRGHKKGHHKQGFQNSYHKDESSNKSTFFDDFNDEGDQAAYNNRQNTHDNEGGRSYRGGHDNGQEYVRDNFQSGGYTRQGDVGNKHTGHHDYGKKYYLDDSNRHHKYHNGQNSYDRGKIHDRRAFEEQLPPPVPHHHPVPHPPPQPHWDWRGWEDDRRAWDDGWQGRRDWERDPAWGRGRGWQDDYGGPGYYDDLGYRHDGGYGFGPNHGYGYDESRAAPVSQAKSGPVLAHRKQTITIYEDPRYDGKDKGQLRREEGDRLQLEYKPSSHRYASYDDTYYAPTREGGGVESSKINRLVYNYRRQ